MGKGRKLLPPPPEWLIRMKEIDVEQGKPEPSEVQLLQKWAGLTKVKRHHAKAHLIAAKERKAIDPDAKPYTPRDRPYDKHDTEEEAKAAHKVRVEVSKDSQVSAHVA